MYTCGKEFQIENTVLVMKWKYHHQPNYESIQQKTKSNEKTQNANLSNKTSWGFKINAKIIVFQPTNNQKRLF